MGYGQVFNKDQEKEKRKGVRKEEIHRGETD